MRVPETQFVSVGDVDLAYQVVGDGPIDILYMPIFGSHLELAWDIPTRARLYEHLASIGRLILFDRRGSGMSDRMGDIQPTWEVWTEDVESVLDAVRSTKAVVVAELDCGPIAWMYAAMHPERVSSLVVMNSTPCLAQSPDYPIGKSGDELRAIAVAVGEMWGKPDLIHLFAESLAHDTDFVRLLSRSERACATPRVAQRHFDYIIGTVDVREALPLVQVPTLILHNTRNPLLPLSHARYAAENMPDARLVEIDSNNLNWDYSRPELLIDALSDFIVGARPAVEIDRILTTVLFTDIVGSTDLAVAQGDHRWRSLLDAHDLRVRNELTRFRGQEIKTTGDGFLATFDGPARAIRCAAAIRESVTDLGIEVRGGLHTGECEVRGNDVGGITVHVAARINALALPSDILVSSTVKELVAGSEIVFTDRGEYELKGVPEKKHLFAVA